MTLRNIEEYLHLGWHRSQGDSRGNFTRGASVPEGLSYSVDSLERDTIGFM